MWGECGGGRWWAKRGKGVAWDMRTVDEAFEADYNLLEPKKIVGVRIFLRPSHRMHNGEYFPHSCGKPQTM